MYIYIEAYIYNNNYNNTYSFFTKSWSNDTYTKKVKFSRKIKKQVKTFYIRLNRSVQLSSLCKSYNKTIFNYTL